MKPVTLRVLAAIFAVTLLNSAATAAVKVRTEAMSEIETVAVVGYSFNRIVEMDASVSMLSSLVELNLSHNRLTGKVPPSWSAW